jgi:Mg2+/citrate symporter
MGPVLVLGVLAVLASFAWRGAKREHRRVVNALKDAEAALDKRSGASVTLERDPATGVYRAPRQRGS